MTVAMVSGCVTAVAVSGVAVNDGVTVSVVTVTISLTVLISEGNGVINEGGTVIVNALTISGSLFDDCIRNLPIPTTKIKVAISTIPIVSMDQPFGGSNRVNRDLSLFISCCKSWRMSATVW